MILKKSSGILLHITSFPGRCGSGTLGPEAYEVIDLLKDGGQSYLQILPIGPVSPGMAWSPYASISTFAGNPLFISPELLKEEKWFTGTDGCVECHDVHFIEYEGISAYRMSILAGACRDFFRNADDTAREIYETFCKNNSYWLDDYSLFTALSERFVTNDWTRWDKALAMRDSVALAEWREKLSERIRFHNFVQYLFFSQWSSFRAYCADKDIKIIGDIPIYITREGSDAWANPGILELDPETGLPTAVAGVPPDYFSSTGQRWGNPLYRWHDESGSLREDTLAWWIMRMRHLEKLVDVIRIDHFRGFESFWSIPADEETAENGKWIPGPGMELFKRLHSELGDLPLIAEDLGIITPEVEKLRDDLALPGMKILQFAFDYNNKNYYLPHNITNPNCVLYTGTHDNNTTNGWFYGNDLDENTRRYVMEYAGSDQFSDFHWQMIRMAYRSVASLVIIPAQDLMGYGGEYRMNKPGTVDNNWRWKLCRGEMKHPLLEKLRAMAHMYSRLPE